MKPLFICVLAISIGVNIWLLVRGFGGPSDLNTSKTGSTVKSAYPKFLDLNRPISCENNMLDVNQLPPCPKGPKPRILPDYYPAHSVFIGYKQGIESTGLFQSLLEMARSSKPQLPLIVMVPRDLAPMAVDELGAYVNESTQNLVHLLATPAKNTIWAQDYFEQAVSGENGIHHIVDLPYVSRYGEHIPSAVALACGFNLISQAGEDVTKTDKLSGNYGGNIMALTDDIVLVGNTMAKSQLETLKENLGQSILEVDVGWLKIGHVDEVFLQVPKVAKPGDCPFDILYASPGRALDLIRKASLNRGGPPKEVRMKFESDGEVYKFNLWDCYSSGKSDKGCLTLLDSNSTYEKIIQKNIGKIRKVFKMSSKSCRGLEFVPVPVLMTASQRQEKYGLSTDNAFTLDPNPVNSILLGDHLLVPRQRLEVLYEETRAVLAKYSLKVKYGDGDYIHTIDGGLHCSANVRRACRP